MTTQKAILASESLPIGVPYESTTSSSAVVIFREFETARPLPLPNSVSLDSLIDEFEADQEMARHMADARRKLSATLYADESDTLSAIRLSAGLSQAQLALKAGTSQSYIARVETGRIDPGTETVSRIANALGVDEAVAFAAIRKQIAMRGRGE